MGSGQQHLRPLGAVLYLDDNRLDAVIDSVFLVGNLLRLRHNRLGLAQVNIHIPVLYPLHQAGNDISLTAGEFLIDDAPLRLTDALHHYLLGSLGGNAAEVCRSHLYLQGIIQLIVRGNLLCHSQGDFLHIVHYFLYHGLDGIHMVLAAGAVQGDTHILGSVKVALIGSHKGSLYCIKEDFRIDSLLHPQVPEGSHKAAILILCWFYLLASCSSGSHYYFTS